MAAASSCRSASQSTADVRERGCLRYRPGVSEPVDLLVLGDANPDLVLTGDVDPAFGQAERLVDEAHLTVGGSGAIVATGAARLGLRVGFCGVVGDDLFGRFLRDELERRGGRRRAPRRGAADRVTVLARPNDRAILTHAGTIATCGPT